jgi:hypothetical protein
MEPDDRTVAKREKGKHSFFLGTGGRAGKPLQLAFSFA